MEHFDFICSVNSETILRVKKLCLQKGFTSHVKRFGERNEHLRFECSKSPFFYENAPVTLRNTTHQNKKGKNFPLTHNRLANKGCPFHLIYKYDPDEEEYYLDCYDEMHNHALVYESRIMPFPKKAVVQDSKILCFSELRISTSSKE